MAKRSTQGALTEFGVSVQAEDLYWRLHGRDGQSFADAAHALGYDEASLRTAAAPLLAFGAVRVDDGILRVPSRPQVIADLMNDEVERLETALRRTRELVAAIPYALAPPPRVPVGEEPLNGYQSTAIDAPTTLAAWINESTGDLLSLRPDQWRRPAHPDLEAAVARAVTAGRLCRALYPARALDEAPEALAARARMGEQIRVLADVPTRMFVIPATHALVPAMPGYESSRLLAVHERGLVLLLAQFFERLWDQAVPVPDLDLRGARHKGRRILLQQLSAGQSDEQVARTLGLSVRTVRRRVAELMIELGADSRFQAGVEATRRGWI